MVGKFSILHIDICNYNSSTLFSRVCVFCTFWEWAGIGVCLAVNVSVFGGTCVCVCDDAECRVYVIKFAVIVILQIMRAHKSCKTCENY